MRSVTSKALLAGGNIIAIGDGSLENWEIVQFTKAEPIARNIWQISELLRGQAGTDGIMPDIWPAGSHVVLLDGGPRQVKLPPNARGQERFWRIGPANRPPDDASYRARITEARGIGLRPYAPCHLRAKGNLISWVRRSRVDGDSWDGSEIPLGEASETYRLRIIKGGTVLHQVDLDQPFYRVPAEIWASATTGGPCTVAVAQLSDRFGPGLFVRRKFDGQ